MSANGPIYEPKNRPPYYQPGCGCSVCREWHGKPEVIAVPAADSKPVLSDTLKDSGERRTFATGAVRDMAKGKGRFDLLQVHGIVRSALQLERGAIKYGTRNWEKGQPLSSYADSAMRHLVKAVAGYDDEPHLDAAIWNLLCWAEGIERIKQGLWPAELDDLPKTYAGKVPGF